MCIICIVLKINILLSYIKFLLNKKLLYLLSKLIPNLSPDVIIEALKLYCLEIWFASSFRTHPPLSFGHLVCGASNLASKQDGQECIKFKQSVIDTITNSIYTRV